jgi:hypothetical protein
MKSWKMRIGVLLAGGALAVLGVGAFGVAQATAAGHPAAVSPLGVYNYNDGGVITEGGAATTLTINANGSFTLIYSSITDSGQWLLYGKNTLALTVTNSEDGSSGCLLVGTVNHRGINSAAKPGPIDCNSQFGKTGTWYASVPHHVR